MSVALEDVVVLDLTTEFWSSLSAAFLGDFGANVIRLETLPAPPKQCHRDDADAADAAWNYNAELIHRNKRSVSLNLTQELGRKLLRELIAKADVIVTDWPLAFLSQHQLDYASVVTQKADIVYARASGFGPKGPDKDLPAIDELAAARTGMMPILPQPGQPPVYTGSGEMHTMVMLAFGVVTALLHRQATGEGQEVDVSLYAGNMYGASLDMQAFLAMGGERFLHPVSRLDGGNPMSGILYPSADGRWVTLTMPDTDRWWPALAESVGLDPNDERFNTHEKRCGESRIELMHLFEELFQKHPGSHWRQVFMEKQMSADVIERFDYPANDPQVLRNRYILELEHPSYGAIKTLGFPVFMSESPARLDRMAPCRGQHSEEILNDLLGYTEDEIERFAVQGAFARR